MINLTTITGIMPKVVRSGTYKNAEQCIDLHDSGTSALRSSAWLGSKRRGQIDADSGAG